MFSSSIDSNAIEKYISSDLSAFIQKSSQNISPNDMKNNVEMIALILEKKPLKIIECLELIVLNEDYVEGIYLFQDLAEKMQNQNCLTKLELLFSNDESLSRLISICIYDVKHIDKLIESIPICEDKLLTKIFSDEACISRIFQKNENNDPNFALNHLLKRYPNYADKFLEQFETITKLFNFKK